MYPNAYALIDSPISNRFAFFCNGVGEGILCKSATLYVSPVFKSRTTGEMKRRRACNEEVTSRRAAVLDMIEREEKEEVGQRPKRFEISK
jgi:hypothetical protein